MQNYSLSVQNSNQKQLNMHNMSPSRFVVDHPEQLRAEAFWDIGLPVSVIQPLQSRLENIHKLSIDYSEILYFLLLKGEILLPL